MCLSGRCSMCQHDKQAADHIEALEARIRELEAERDNLADKVRWMDPLIKEHHDAAQRFWEKWQAAEAYAQKHREALAALVEVCSGEVEEVFQGEIGGEVKQDRKALALTPTAALAAVRDEVREECAKIAEVQADEEDHAVGFLCSQEIAAAIRARKEAGE